MMKYIVGVLALIVVALGAYALLSGRSATPQERESAEAPRMPLMAATSTFASSTMGISLVYPSTYSVNESYAYDAFGPEKLIRGVKFAIPGATATGTNLSLESGVSVEQLPRAKRCTGDIYLRADVRPATVTQSGIDYSVASSTEGAAGTTNEEIVYAYFGSAPCTAVRYTIRSTDIGNYEPGMVREFDRAALLKEFDAIRASLTLSTAATTTSR